MDETPARQVDGTAEQAVEEPSKTRESRSQWVWATAVVLAVAGLLAYCSIRANNTDPAPARAATCAEWSAKGSANRVIQAREMLTALRQADGLGAPETAVAQRFADALTSACGSSPGDARLAELAAGVYVTQRGTFG